MLCIENDLDELRIEAIPVFAAHLKHSDTTVERAIGEIFLWIETRNVVARVRMVQQEPGCALGHFGLMFSRE